LESIIGAADKECLTKKQNAAIYTPVSGQQRHISFIATQSASQPTISPANDNTFIIHHNIIQGQPTHSLI
jgi:hypothetical protein